jgi:hypothetical protein
MYRFGNGIDSGRDCFHSEPRSGDIGIIVGKQILHGQAPFKKSGHKKIPAQTRKNSGYGTTALYTLCSSCRSRWVEPKDFYRLSYHTTATGGLSRFHREKLYLPQ